MTAAAPVIPGRILPEVVYAKDQPEYLPLPALQMADGRVVTRWRLTWKERLQIFLFGNLWLSVLTFGRPLQPVRLDTAAPVVEVERL